MCGNVILTASIKLILVYSNSSSEQNESAHICTPESHGYKYDYNAEIDIQCFDMIVIFFLPFPFSLGSKSQKKNPLAKGKFVMRTHYYSCISTSVEKKPERSEKEWTKSRANITSSIHTVSLCVLDRHTTAELSTERNRLIFTKWKCEQITIRFYLNKQFVSHSIPVW